MDGYLSLPTKCYNNTARVLHITDTHLFANSSDNLLGVNTNKTFDAVIQEIQNLGQGYDLIVATGDFVQDGSKKAYCHFAERISQLSTPCVWLPGNHDLIDIMSDAFSHSQLWADKLVNLGEHWVIILLNTQVVGQAYGYLADDQLAFLASSLKHNNNKNILVLLHHHPFESGCQWLDQHSLKNSEQLKNIVQEHPQIRAVGCGHIHQEMLVEWQDCMVFSSPSTCVQFMPSCNNFTLDTKQPGWRDVILYANGKIETVVHRLNLLIVTPDMTINGY